MIVKTKNENSAEIIVPTHPRIQRKEAQQHSISKILDQPNQRAYFMTALTCFISVLPLAVIGGISGFQPGLSTVAQRGIIITWLICSSGFLFLFFPLVCASISVYFFITNILGHSVDFLTELLMVSMYFSGVFYLLLTPAAIAMFVIVAQEMWQYGNCQYIG
jgi:hypothetical protein